MGDKIFMPPPPKELKQNSTAESDQDKNELKNQTSTELDVGMQSNVQFGINGETEGQAQEKVDTENKKKNEVYKRNKSGMIFSFCVFGLIVSLGAIGIIIYLLFK